MRRSIGVLAIVAATLVCGGTLARAESTSSDTAESAQVTASKASATFSKGLRGTWLVIISIPSGDRHYNGWTVFEISHTKRQWTARELAGEIPALKAAIDDANKEGKLYEPSAETLAVVKAKVSTLTEPTAPSEIDLSEDTTTKSASQPKETRVLITTLNDQGSRDYFHIRKMTADAFSGETTSVATAVVPPITLHGTFSARRLK